jgi:hypothetical protein
MAQGFTFGVGKHGARDWEGSLDIEDNYRAVMSHVTTWSASRSRPDCFPEIDKDSGLPHLTLAITRLAMLIGSVERRKNGPTTSD